MKIRRVTEKELPRVSKVMVSFLRKYGDGRITFHALRWFRDIKPEYLTKSTLIAAALDDKKLIGLITFGDYGIDESFIAVHPQYRNQGIGEKLLLYSLENLDRVYTRVACDNTPSLKLCFSCGLIAFDLFKGPTGKPTLWLGGGNWFPEEIQAKSGNSKQANQ